MLKIYFIVLFVLTYFSITPKIARAQDCSLLNATYQAYESRCAATGSIKVFATGGSGSYKYKTIGPVNSNFTTSDSLTGLSAGTYSVVVTDIVSNCTYTQAGIIVPGSYEDPRFALNKVDVSCYGGNNGKISVAGQLFGRSPFMYSIEAPSPMGVGSTSTSGVFDNLSAGNYTIRLTDSCGGIQTRQITVNDYTWFIDGYKFTKIGCDSASGFVKVMDNRGNISTVGGIPGFEYGIVRQPGDTIWSSSPNFQFDLLGNTNFTVLAKDSCGNIRKSPVQLIIAPSINAVVISSQGCTTFTATVTGATNFFTAEYCLFDNSSSLIQCNATGIFANLTYGNYCIKVHDLCTNLTITRCFSVAPPPLGINNTVFISNKTCSIFSATVTGQYGLTNPNYCLYDATDTQLACNGNGVFDNLAYGYYCIKVKDGCRDTTITSCFSPTRPMPSIPDVITPRYISCSTFNISIGGDSLTSPSYCLYDSVGVLINCNSTGVFDNLILGDYCAHIHDACFDTTFIRCFRAGSPLIINDITLNVSNKACSSFTLTTNSNNITKALFCLYDANDSLINCDSSGIFYNIPYGSYCVKANNECPDTVFYKCITVNPSVPVVSSSVRIINKNCNTFSAQIHGQHNLTDPIYCIYDSTGAEITCNSTGQFDNLLYGNYCINITDSCYDTTMVRCFAVNAPAAKISVTSTKSCSYNFAKFSISVVSGILPVNIQIYTFSGSLFFTGNYNSNNFSIDSIPGSLTGQGYKVIVTDSCGKQDSVNVDAMASYLTHKVSGIPKCPSGTYANGSGDIQAIAGTNMGSLSVKIIKKDNTILSPGLSPSTVIDSNYTFQDQGPGTYILSYKANDACNIYFQDTVVIQPYQFPNLSRSSAYQCDSNGFNLKAIVSNGVGPFSYEIIGSTPATPSIIAGPQTNPDFYINNGTNYSLVRLRALDACSNATLADASILPLANNAIINTYNCFQIATTLSMDTVYNASFAWYKKDQDSSTDSTYLGSASSIFVPEVTPGDTGIYVCRILVGAGCINRTYYYHLDGSCFHYLPVTLQDFTGNFTGDAVVLNWKAATEPGVSYFVIEKKTGNGDFEEIGRISVAGSSGNAGQYNFTDKDPGEQNLYRVKWFNTSQSVSYSNIVTLNKHSQAGNIQVYPNPVTNLLNVGFINPRNHVYNIALLNVLNQVVKEFKGIKDVNGIFQIERTPNMKKGLYILKVEDLTNTDIFTGKVIFR
jgi:hypothetical protein